MPRKPLPRQRWIVYEQTGDNSRVADCFGIFYSWDRANTLCSQLQRNYPQNWYGIRELLYGGRWVESGNRKLGAWKPEPLNRYTEPTQGGTNHAPQDQTPVTRE